MSHLTHTEITALFLALGLLLASARIMGELARAMNLPAVLGEISAGILWGPTVFGVMFPKGSAFLFPQFGGGALAFDGLITLAITLFLLVAGMEIDLSTVWRQGKITLNVSIAGIVVPCSLGFVFAWYFPWQMGKEDGANLLIFALFIATALSISALPVIAKTLLDLNLYRTDMGMLVVASAVLNDLVGWIAFAVVLGMLGSAATALSIGQTILLTLAFVVFMLTLGRWGVNATLPWVQAHSSWPGGVLGYALSLCLIAAAFTEWIGIHAIFGSFLAGVALGDSKHLSERTRTTINQFISFIFAPLFFASIGLKVNFIENFDLKLIVLVLVIATLGKVVGCGLAARFSGLGKREAWAVGFGLNARGAMEIILGLLALQNGIIGERLFVALVIMALVTSLMSGPMLQVLLRLKKSRRFVQYLQPQGFVSRLTSTDRWAAIHELAKQAANQLDISPEIITRAAYAREKLMPTGIGQGVAIPHARLTEINHPVVLVGLSRTGIDFDAPDAAPAKVIFLILAPSDDDGVQLEILADIAATFKVDEIREKVGAVNNYVEFLALVRSARGQ